MGSSDRLVDQGPARYVLESRLEGMWPVPLAQECRIAAFAEVFPVWLQLRHQFRQIDSNLSENALERARRDRNVIGNRHTKTALRHLDVGSCLPQFGESPGRIHRQAPERSRGSFTM